MPNGSGSPRWPPTDAFQSPVVAVLHVALIIVTRSAAPCPRRRARARHRRTAAARVVRSRDVIESPAVCGVAEEQHERATVRIRRARPPRARRTARRACRPARRGYPFAVATTRRRDCITGTAITPASPTTVGSFGRGCCVPLRALAVAADLAPDERRVRCKLRRRERDLTCLHTGASRPSAHRTRRRPSCWRTTRRQMLKVAADERLLEPLRRRASAAHPRVGRGRNAQPWLCAALRWASTSSGITGRDGYSLSLASA